jgi:hypothetical protein
MAASINTNVASLTAQRNLGISQNSLNNSINRLSSGLRINSAKDDAAGLAIGALYQPDTWTESGCAQCQRRYLVGANC